jgi:hypothetical protein
MHKLLLTLMDVAAGFLLPKCSIGRYPLAKTARHGVRAPAIRRDLLLQLTRQIESTIEQQVWTGRVGLESEATPCLIGAERRQYSPVHRLRSPQRSNPRRECSHRRVDFRGDLGWPLDSRQQTDITTGARRR